MFVGVDIPILPGIMPIQNYGGFKRMTTLCKTFVPNHILSDLEPIKVSEINVHFFRMMIKLSRSMVSAWPLKCATR
jgi:methylenetetrahydrofolate reductase (NADPH)